jgi:hypothetical protein
MLTTRALFASAAALTLVFAGSAPLTAAPLSVPAAQKETAQSKDVKKVKKSQEESASKSATFTTVAATDKSVTGAVKATDLEGVKKLVGKPITFTGTVTKAFAPKGNNLVILNFAADYKTAVTAIVRQDSFSAFPLLATLEGKKVVVTGTVTEYQGRPEIELKTPSQIKLVK